MFSMIRHHQIKIFVVGPFQAGKTTIVHLLDPKAFSIEREYYEGNTRVSTTVGFDLGKLIWLHDDNDEILDASTFKETYRNVNIDGCEVWEVFLFGAPGQMRFQDTREAVSKGSDGVLFIIDSTKPGQVGHVLALFEEVKMFLGDYIPIVVVANKQDLEDALKAEEIRGVLKLNNVKVVEASAIKGEGVREALIELLKMIREVKLRKNKELEVVSDV